MNNLNKHSSSPWLAGILILLVLTVQPALAGDVWEGVFAYQKKMADYGNPEAQVKLGEMYEEGHGTDKDYSMARQWYQKAASQGYAPAKKKLVGLAQREKEEAEARQRAEQERIALEKAEKERIAREKAQAAERARQAKLDKERREREAAQERLARERAAKAEEEKARKAEEERLARQRAQEAMKKMMATPSAYTED